MHLFDLPTATWRARLHPASAPGGDGFGLSLPFPAQRSSWAHLVRNTPTSSKVREGRRIALADLNNLEFLSLSNTGIEQVEPAARSRSVALCSIWMANRIGDISSPGRSAGDRRWRSWDSPPPLDGSRTSHPVSGTFQEDYRFIPSAGPLNPSPRRRRNGPSPAWRPAAMPVLVTWPPSESRAAGGQYSIFDGDTATTPEATVPVDQKLAPSGSVLGGVAWQSLGVFSNTTGTLRVRLTDTAADQRHGRGGCRADRRRRRRDRPGQSDPPAGSERPRAWPATR